VPIQLFGFIVSNIPDSRLPLTRSEIQASFPSIVQATWTFIPVVLCLPEYNTWCRSHFGQVNIRDPTFLDVNSTAQPRQRPDSEILTRTPGAR
jgi:hypothetical protein